MKRPLNDTQNLDFLRFEDEDFLIFNANPEKYDRPKSFYVQD